MLKTAEKILKKPICDSCLGRQWAMVLSGYTNAERGKAIRLALLKHKGKFTQNDFKKFLKSKEKVKIKKQRCWVCEGLFKKLDEITKKILVKTKQMEFNSFLVGVILSNKLLKNEETLWEQIGTEHCESIKTELSREIGKRIEKITKKKVDFKKPELAILVNLERDTIEFKISSLFIYGKYKKYAKIPQTKWPCKRCGGRGCSYCDYKGKLYPTSVEEKINKILLNKSKGKGTKFSGAGREDIDVQCLDWREFVIEITEPKKRKLDLKTIEKQINKKNKGKIAVCSLKFCDKKKAVELKEKKTDKTYEVVVQLPKPVKNLNKLKKLKGMIRQQTPTRVLHRRTDKIRKRQVKSISYKKVNSKKIKLIIKAEAGTYVKELVTGDNERTKPSVNGLLGVKPKIISVKVIKMG